MSLPPHRHRGQNTAAMSAAIETGKPEPMRISDHEIGPTAPIDSPCMGVCKIDPANRLCVGCARSIDEIAGWARMSPEDRRSVMAGLQDRRAAATWSLDLPAEVMASQPTVAKRN